MAQVRAALGADSFDTAHAVADVHTFFDGAVAGRFRKAGPAAAGVEFGVRAEQGRVAADAAVSAFGPVALVLAGKGTFRSGLARDRKGHRFGTLGGQQLAPLLIGFGDGAHDEQLISSWPAQSGGKSA